MHLGQLKDDWAFIDSETLRSNIASELQKVHFDILLVNEYNVYYSPEAMTMKHAIIALASVAEAVLEVAVKMIEDDPRVLAIIETRQRVFDEMYTLQLQEFENARRIPCRYWGSARGRPQSPRPQHEDGLTDTCGPCRSDCWRGDGEEAAAAPPASQPGSHQDGRRAGVRLVQRTASRMGLSTSSRNSDLWQKHGWRRVPPRRSPRSLCSEWHRPSRRTQRTPATPGDPTSSDARVSSLPKTMRDPSRSLKGTGFVCGASPFW